MLAKANPHLPTGSGWFYEMKWDGVRALASVSGGELTLTSRLDNNVTAAYPELAGLAQAAPEALLDGEIVAFHEGRPSFAALQTRMHVRTIAQAQQLSKATPVTFLIFDILQLSGVDLTTKPYWYRRRELANLNLDGPHWTVSPTFDDGPATLAISQENGLEGVVAKRSGSRYQPGIRSSDWIKVRFGHRQEFVVGGWQLGEGARSKHFGSLVLGYYTDHGLEYAGKVGGGFTQATLRDLTEKLLPLRRPESPFATSLGPREQLNVVWCEPQLVVEVSFASWTRDGRLRFPIYQGIRTDKNPLEVRRE